MKPADFEQLVRELTPRVLGCLVREFRDFAAAEDALQEALLAAATQWSAEGIPENPRAWLIHVASRRLADQIRSDSARRRRETQAAMAAGYAIPPVEPVSEEPQDDTLKLIYLCCHPSLTSSSAIALTLRAVGGLTTAEIARAFLVPESTMAQRISRAKRMIGASGVPFQMPGPDDQARRLRSVLHILYLIFNEGYAASSGTELHRADLATEAIRLAQLLHEQLPLEGEAAGLLALMLLTDARRAARIDASGEPVPLDKQNRSLWNQQQIRQGLALLHAAFSRGSVGSYQLQAAVAALHDEAPSADKTDWPQILALYEILWRMSANPMVALNQAVAYAMVHGPEAGLERLAEVSKDPVLAAHHRLYAVRGHLRERMGDSAGAVADYQEAATRTTSLAERNYLLRQAARLREQAFERNESR